MRIINAILLTLLSATMLFAQSTVLRELRDINDQTISTTDMIVSDRGLSRFMGAKVASYLSDGGDLSLFDNYAVLNSTDGRLSLNHNIAFKTKNESIRRMITLGVRANVTKAFSGVINDSDLADELGIAIKYTYFSPGSACFDDQCQKESIEKLVEPSRLQKEEMNKRRAFILASLESEIQKEVQDFEASLDKIRVEDARIENLDEFKVKLKDQFIKGLNKKYRERFADLEAKALEEGVTYKRIKKSWVSFSGYIPVTNTTYNVAETFATSFGDKKLYPWEVSLSFNGIIENSKSGRFFFFLNVGAAMNNAVKANLIKSVDLNTYKNLGGTDTLSYSLLESNKAFVGSYSDFITPNVKVQVVWFPPKSSIGLSALIEQNTGDFDPLNGKLGIPVRLKGKGDNSFVNFEIQARAIDMNNTVMPDKSISKKTTYGISVGLPFSSLIY